MMPKSDTVTCPECGEEVGLTLKQVSAHVQYHWHRTVPAALDEAWNETAKARVRVMVDALQEVEA